VGSSSKIFVLFPGASPGIVSLDGPILPQNRRFRKEFPFSFFGPPLFFIKQGFFFSK